MATGEAMEQPHTETNARDATTLPLQAAQRSCAPLRSSYPFIGNDVFRDLCDVYDPHKDFKLTVPSLVFLHFPHFKPFGEIVDSLEYDVQTTIMIPYSTSDQGVIQRFYRVPK